MEWPFVGRNDEIARAVDWLGRADGNVVVLVGEAGVGKSRLATEIALRMSDGGNPLVLHGFESCTQRRYIPFSQVFGPDDRPNDPREAADRLKRWVGAAPIVGFDDIQWYDDDSAAAVARFVRDGWTPVVLALRAGLPVPAAIERIIHSEYVLTLPLVGLDRASFGDAVDHVLGGIMLDGSKDVLHRASAGNPLLARELLITGRADGRLRFVGARWVLDAAPTVQHGQVNDQIERHLSELDPRMLAALESLAIAEPAPLGFAEAILGDDYATAIGAGLIIEHRESVRFAHPLISASLRTTRSHLQRFGALRALLDIDATSPYPDRLSVIEWRLELDDEITLDELRRATTRAIVSNDARAERLARAAIVRGGGLTSKLQLIAALRAVGSPEQFSIIDANSIDDAAPGSERLGAILVLAAQLVHHARDLDAALALLDRGAQLEPGAMNEAAFAAARTHFLCWFDRHHEALPHALFVTDNDANRFARAGTYPNLVGILLACGDPEGALEAGDRAEAHAAETSSFVGQTPSSLESNRVEALITLGRAVAAREHATDTYQRYRASGLDHGHLSTLAEADASVGNIERAIERYGEFLELLESRAIAGAGQHHARLARLLAINGQGELAQRQIEAATYADGTYDTSLLFRARLHVAALDGGLPTDALIDEGRSWCRNERHLTNEINLHLDLARLGAATESNVDRMRVLTEQLHYEWIGTQAEAVRALVAADADALLLGATRFAAAGFNGYAADLYAAAANAVGPGRRPAFVADARRRRDESLMAAPGWTVLSDPASERRPDDTLTPREREVAACVAAGMSTRRIADELQLSPRTVANFVQRCYDKLGVNTREALANAATR